MRNLWKQLWLRILLIALAVILIGGSAMCIYFWYNGRKILYQVDAMAVTQDQDLTTISIEGTAKQWWFDLGQHTFRLDDTYQGGELFYCEVAESDYITTKPFSNTPFRLTATFKSSEWYRVGFEAINQNGNEIIASALNLRDFEALFQEANLKWSNQQSSGA